ncbi:MAG: hypothetical protein ILP01_00780 [Clostridia bacterium]|nr:hypothetical protein [Clostridia bacterium]
MKRTLIDFFDTENLNNCIAHFFSHYDEAFYFYREQYRDEKTEKVFSSLKKFNISKAGISPVFIPVTEADYSVSWLIARLASICEEAGPDSEYDIDLSGGNELFLASAGIFVGGLKSTDGGPRISMRKYDVPSGREIIRYPDYSPSGDRGCCCISVADQIMLHGAECLSRGLPLTDRRTTEKLWDSVRWICRDWNRFCTDRQTVCSNKDGGLTVCKEYSDSETKARLIRIADRLSASGLTGRPYEKTIEEKKYIAFDTSLSRGEMLLFEKSGTLLELVSYYAALESRRFPDVKVGLAVDWDGRVDRLPGEPKNEIDVVMSDGLLPWFMSCKNTAVTNEALYEIGVVSSHYGGRFARKLMATTQTASEGQRKRAEALNVLLIDGIARMTIPELAARLAGL